MIASNGEGTAEASVYPEGAEDSSFDGAD